MVFHMGFHVVFHMGFHMVFLIVSSLGSSHGFLMGTLGELEILRDLVNAIFANP